MKATSIALTILLGLLAGIASAQIRILNVTNLADGLYGLPAYGSLAAISCAGWYGIVGTIQATQFPPRYQLAGVSVSVDGHAASLLAITDTGSNR
jgi:hypothetical protein